MTFFNEEYPFYCGVDLHARTMYVCVIDGQGNKLVHRNLRTNPAAFLEAIAFHRDGIVVGVECVFCWYWLADLCQREGIDFVLGHALYMKAIHGGKTKNDRLDAFKLASLLWGGNFPVAYAYPAEHRATRDLLRRRHYLVRLRAELLAHVQNTATQYNLPPLAKNIAYAGNRVGAAALFPDPLVRRDVEVDLELLSAYDRQIKQLDRFLETTTKASDPDTFRLLRTVPGVGRTLGMTILYEVGTIERFARVQDFLSYCRLVKPTKTSAGERTGEASGKKIGNAHLKWAFGEATLVLLREEEGVKRYKHRLEGKHGKGKALSILSAKLGRAAYYMLKRHEPFNIETFLSC